MRRLSSLDRVRAMTAAVAGGTIAMAVLGLLLADSILLGRAAVDASQSDAADLGVQYALIVTLFYAPFPLVLGIAAHLVAAVAIRRAVRRWWSWFAT